MYCGAACGAELPRKKDLAHTVKKDFFRSGEQQSLLASEKVAAFYDHAPGVIVKSRDATIGVREGHGFL